MTDFKIGQHLSQPRKRRGFIFIDRALANLIRVLRGVPERLGDQTCIEIEVPRHQSSVAIKFPGHLDELPYGHSCTADPGLVARCSPAIFDMWKTLATVKM